MRTLLKCVLPVATMCIALSTSGCGAGVSTGVYVGVAVPGPYVGYPGYGRPGYIGRPPYVYEEDALNLPAGSRDNVALSTDSAIEATRGCRLETRDRPACAERERDQRTADPVEEAPSRSDRRPWSDY